MRTLVLRAVAARGALTDAGVVEHWRLRGGVAGVKPYIDALVAAGALRREAVDDGGPPVLIEAGADVEAAKPAGAVLLSPFDNLLWDRPFAERVLGFRHLIEVYKPAPERRYGYYVLPLVVGDRVAGRADVKADRKAGVLRAARLAPRVAPAIGGPRRGARARLLAPRPPARARTGPLDSAAVEFETRAIHAGQDPDPHTGAVTVPIYATSTYAQRAVGEFRYDYSRTANPTREAFETCLASLEGAEHGIAFGSGMAATTTVMHLLEPGAHVVRGERRLRRHVSAASRRSTSRRATASPT